MQTIQQQRAKFALERVLRVSHNNSAKQNKEYKAYASQLPAMIHMNGLGQAAAFYKSKCETHQKLYNLLSDWLTQPDQPYADYSDLLAGITQADMHRYRLAQSEAQAFMDWVKKFASAYMAED